MATENLTADRLRELFDYSPGTGLFTRRKARGQCRVGAIAGAIHPEGYRVIVVDRRQYMAGRLAWLYVHGVWPNPTIDHANRNPADDRIDNLREARQSQQNANRRTMPRKTNLPAGVYPMGKRFRTYAKLNGVKKYLGTFDTAEQARAAYLRASQANHGAFFSP